MLKSFKYKLNMSNLEKLAEKLGITLDELKSRIAKNKTAEEDLIQSSAKKKKKN